VISGHARLACFINIRTTLMTWTWWYIALIHPSRITGPRTLPYSYWGNSGSLRARTAVPRLLSALYGQQSCRTFLFTTPVRRSRRRLQQARISGLSLFPAASLTFGAPTIAPTRVRESRNNACPRVWTYRSLRRSSEHPEHTGADSRLSTVSSVTESFISIHAGLCSS
jgi:hypothetical protein